MDNMVGNIVSACNHDFFSFSLQCLQKAINPIQNNPWILGLLGMKGFENIVDKGENAGNQHFPLILCPRIERLGAYCFTVVHLSVLSAQT